MEKLCVLCGNKHNRPRSFFCSRNCEKKNWAQLHKDKVKECRKKCYQKNKEKWRLKNKEYNKNWKLIKKFGIDLKTYNEMLDSQTGKCAICRKEPKDETLAVDHDHNTGKVRGLLCRSCNVGLGHFNEDIELIQKGIEYLKKYKEEE